VFDYPYKDIFILNEYKIESIKIEHQINKIEINFDIKDIIPAAGIALIKYELIDEEGISL
jgi:hypothetical protein